MGECWNLYRGRVEFWESQINDVWHWWQLAIMINREQLWYWMDAFRTVWILLMTPDQSFLISPLYNTFKYISRLNILFFIEFYLYGGIQFYCKRWILELLIFYNHHKNAINIRSRIINTSIIGTKIVDTNHICYLVSFYQYCYYE